MQEGYYSPESVRNQLPTRESEIGREIARLKRRETWQVCICL